MDPTSGRTAADVVNQFDEDALVELFTDNGEGRFARRIARAIVAARPLATTGQLADVVRAAIPAATRRTGGHPARRVFQAIRIAVNEELDQLATALDDALALLRPGGRCVVISYHSGEDRLVKTTFTRAATDDCHCPPGLPCVCGADPQFRLVARGARRPTADEIGRNHRAEAARLRVIERLPGRHPSATPTAKWPDGAAGHRHRPARPGPPGPRTAPSADLAGPALRLFEPAPRRRAGGPRRPAVDRVGLGAPRGREACWPWWWVMPWSPRARSGSRPSRARWLRRSPPRRRSRSPWPGRRRHRWWWPRPRARAWSPRPGGLPAAGAARRSPLPTPPSTPAPVDAAAGLRHRSRPVGYDTGDRTADRTGARLTLDHGDHRRAPGEPVHPVGSALTRHAAGAGAGLLGPDRPTDRRAGVLPPALRVAVRLGADPDGVACPPYGAASTTGTARCWPSR